MNDDHIKGKQNEDPEEFLSESEHHDKFIESLKGQIPTVTVEPLILFYIVVVYLQSYVMGQYILYRVGTDYNITRDENLAHVCQPNPNGSDKEMTDEIQEINAQYSMFIQLSACVSTVLTAPFFCVFSDRFGRKPMFLIPGIGIVLKSISEVLVIVFNWPIYLFIVTEGCYGFFGGFPFVIGLSYSYIADISTSKQRTKRMAILGAMIAIGALFISLGIGFWINRFGYLSPYIFSSGVSIFCVIYPIFYLKESPKMHNSRTDKDSLMNQFKSLFTIYWNRPSKQRALFFILLIMFNFYYVAEMSVMSLTTTFVMSYPICMNTIEISIISFVRNFCLNVGVAVTVIIFKRYMGDLVLVELSLLSELAFSLQMAFAANKTAVYIACSTNFISYSAFPFIRGYLSKKMSPREQGALFGGLALSETISAAIIKVVIIYFYGATFKIFHGMVYLFLGMISVVALVLTLIAIVLERFIGESNLSINTDTK